MQKMTHSHLISQLNLYHYNSHTKYEHNINSNHKENSENVSEMSQTATVQIKSFIQTLHNIKHNKYIHLLIKQILFASVSSI